MKVHVKQDGRFLYVSLFTVGCVVAFLWVVQPHFRGGDWGYYVDVADRTRPPFDARFGGTPDHPIVPYLLIFFNLFIRNASVTVFGFTIVGFSLTYLMVYHLAGKVCGNRWVPLILFLFALGSTPAMVSPTALKNLWGLVFYLATLTVIYRTSSVGLNLNTTLLVASSLLTVLSHSLPVFLLIPSLLAFSLNHWSPKLFLLATLTVPLSYMVLHLVNRLRKLSFGVLTLLSDPTGVIGYNLLRISVTMIVFPFFLMFIFSVLFEGVFELVYGGVKPVFWGVAVGVAIMFFSGAPTFAGRFYVNATPSILLLFTHLISLFPRLKEVNPR